MVGRKSYHHGNLREALVEATATLIEEMGPLAFTLTEAARRAGVSLWPTRRAGTAPRPVRGRWVLPLLGGTTEGPRSAPLSFS